MLTPPALKEEEVPTSLGMQAAPPAGEQMDSLLQPVKTHIVILELLTSKYVR